jgi:hypothetical protein
MHCKVRFLCLIGTLLLSFLSMNTLVNSTQCGYVYDWGTENIGQQYSTNFISASWAGFQDTENEENNNKIRYEWAIISEKLATDAIRNADSVDGPRCRAYPGFEGKPDIQDWTEVDSTYASNNKLTLFPGSTYWVILRVTTLKQSNVGAPEILYTNGAGISISTEARLAERGKFNKHFVRKHFKRSPSPSPELLYFSSSSLSLSSFSSYQDLSSGLLGWQIALIIIACVFATILILVLIFILVGRSKADDKYETNVHRNENVEKI